jgi:O-antigen/teichoic acid export membrane protein
MDLFKSKIFNILRWSEKYTKTDMVYLAKGGFWLTSGQIFSTILVFASSILFANFVDPKIFGEYKFILSLAAILSVFSLSGLRSIVLNRSAQGSNSILKLGFYKNLKWSGPLFVVATGISIYYLLNGNQTLGWSLLVIAFLEPMHNSGLLYGPFLNGKKEYKQNTIMWVIGQIIITAGLIAMIFIGPNTLNLIITYFILHTLVNLTLYFITLKKYPVIKDEVQTKPINTESFHLSIVNVINTTANHIDKILTFHFLGAQMTALYTFSIAFPEQIKSIIKNISKLALPKYATKDLSEISKDITKKVLKSSIFIIPIIIVYIIAAPFLFELILPRYTDGILASQLIAITLIFSLSSLPISAIQAHEKYNLMYKFSFYTNITKIVITFIFIYYYGFYGAIFALLISRLIAFVISILLIRTQKIPQ